MSADGGENHGTRMSTQTLIGLLARDAGLRARFGATILKAAGLGAAIAAAIFLALLHPRQDIEAVAGTARFLFKFAFTLPLAFVGLGLVNRLGRPAAPLGPWPWLLLGVAGILAAGVGLELSVVPPTDWTPRLIGTNSRYCLLLIPLIAIGPLACLISALRWGAPSRPGLVGGVAGLAASGIAASLYATHCIDDSPLFVATWYTTAIGLVVACGYGAGRRFLGT